MDYETKSSFDEINIPGEKIEEWRSKYRDSIRKKLESDQNGPIGRLSRHLSGNQDRILQSLVDKRIKREKRRIQRERNGLPKETPLEELFNTGGLSCLTRPMTPEIMLEAQRQQAEREEMLSKILPFLQDDSLDTDSRIKAVRKSLETDNES